MISNPNEAPAETKIVLKEACPSLDSANNMTPNEKVDNVAKLQSETNSAKDDENKEEEATTTDTTSMNGDSSSMTEMSSSTHPIIKVSENDLPNTVKLVNDSDINQDDNETNQDEENGTIQDVAGLNISMIEDDDVEVSSKDETLQDCVPNVAGLNISMIEDDGGDDNDYIVGGKNSEQNEEYDEVLHNLDDFDLYKLDYESDRAEDGGLENLQSPVRPSKPSSEASHQWPNAAGGETLKPGDHVYMWCTVYQHHGIVLSTEPTANPPHALIAEFTNLALAQANTFVVSSSAASGATVGSGATGAYRFVKETETTKWHKMKYNANPFECITWRPGTCSAARPSKARKVLLRVQFLHDCRHLLPEYHLLSSNCETVAVWCLTGKWETLQYHHTMKWSQGASVGLLPVAPGIAGLAAGLAFWHSSQTKGQWKDTEEKLNENFKWYALGRTPKWSFEESSP